MFEWTQYFSYKCVIMTVASWFLLVLRNLYWASPLVNQSSVDRGETLVFKDPQQAPFFFCFMTTIPIDNKILPLSASPGSVYFLSFKRDAFFFCRKIIWMFIALTHGVEHYFQRTTLDSRFDVIIFHTLNFFWSSCLSCKDKQKQIKHRG